MKLLRIFTLGLPILLPMCAFRGGIDVETKYGTYGIRGDGKSVLLTGTVRLPDEKGLRK